jgi:hypothetical protein
MSNDEAGGWDVFLGLCLGALAVLGGPIGLILGGIAFAGGWGIGKSISQARRKNSSSSNSGFDFDLLRHFPYQDKKESNNTLFCNSYTLPKTDFSLFTSENQFRIPDISRANNRHLFMFRDEYHIPTPPTHYEPLTPTYLSLQRKTPTSSHTSHTHQRMRRFRVSEYGEVFEE